MATYRGEQGIFSRQETGGVVRELALHDHSPTGSLWGYSSCGPEQLAFTLLADALGDDDRAFDLYQDFVREILAGLGASWALTSDEIVAWSNDKQPPELSPPSAPDETWVEVELGGAIQAARPFAWHTCPRPRRDMPIIASP